MVGSWAKRCWRRGCYEGGPYRALHRSLNLPDGVVPVVDGIPRWPWDEVVVRRRLSKVAKLAGLRLTGDEVFVESGSNDTWFVPGDMVLQVCYRGEVGECIRRRLARRVRDG